MLGLPTLDAFLASIGGYIAGLQHNKAENFFMARDKLDDVIATLLNPYKTSIRSPGFRHWARENFRLDPHDSTIVLHAPKSATKHGHRPRVVAQEEVHAVIGRVHVKVGHLGRDKTFDAIKKDFAYIPKEAVGHYIKLCPTCNSRRSTTGPPRRTANKPKKPSSPSPPSTPIRPSRLLASAFASTSSEKTASPPLTIPPSSPGPVRALLRREASPSLLVDDVLPSPPAHCLAVKAPEPPSTPSSPGRSNTFAAGNTGRTASRRSSLPQPPTSPSKTTMKEQPSFFQSSLEMLGAVSSSSSPAVSSSFTSSPTRSFSLFEAATAVPSSPASSIYSTPSCSSFDAGVATPLRNDPFLLFGTGETTPFYSSFRSSSYTFCDTLNPLDTELSPSTPSLGYSPSSSSWSSSSSTFSSPPSTPTSITSYGTWSAFAPLDSPPFLASSPQLSYSPPPLDFSSLPFIPSDDKEAPSPFKPTSARGWGLIVC